MATIALGGVASAERSPGPLSQGHAALDTGDQCQACHTVGKALGNDKCLGCHQHEPLKRRIDEGKGLHASEKVTGRQCYLCHTEHKGRARDIMGFGTLGGIAKFDHALAGWKLDGAHAKTACEKCHPRKTTFLGAPSTCDGCHKSPHGDLRAPLRKCERCHSTKNWTSLPSSEFDHDNPADARFSLEGNHDGVPCAKCHERGLVFRAAASPPDCTPCHANPHGDKFAKRKCAVCHNAKSKWTQLAFDHARTARFPLDGKHAKVECATCHLPTRPKTPRACEGCHPDPHAGRFAAVKPKDACGNCHSAKGWPERGRYNHEKQAGFALTGKHGEVECRKCHRGDSPSEFEKFAGLVTKAGVACMSCHQHENVHKKQYKDGECLRCHQAAGNVLVKADEAASGFHAESTTFPLSEGHAGVACEKCHHDPSFKGAKTECGACHEDRLHKGSLGAACVRCHEGAHWPATKFDHDDSPYPLVGHHQTVKCDFCHPQRAYKPTSRKCADCHQQHDAHKGTLGRDCEKCHTPSGRSLFDHNDPAAPGRFRLEGKHAAVKCNACHSTTVFKSVAKTCDGCHAEPPSHKGQLGTKCATCHDAVGWKSIHTGHDTAAFRFGGAHDRLRCATCHPGGRKLAGTAELCIACHRRDDIHHNTLGPKCGECHGQQSWGGPVRFFHERVGCDLRGVHRALPCLDCHVGGNFLALAPTCGACHRADALRATTPDHRALLGVPCSQCHNVNFFGPMARPDNRESVCQ